MRDDDPMTEKSPDDLVDAAANAVAILSTLHRHTSSAARGLGHRFREIPDAIAALQSLGVRLASVAPLSDAGSVNMGYRRGG
jgi:hypothetical protein